MNYNVEEKTIYKVRSLAHPKDPLYFEKEFQSSVDCSIFILQKPFDNICTEIITTTNFYKDDILMKQIITTQLKYINGIGIKNESST